MINRTSQLVLDYYETHQNIDNNLLDFIKIVKSYSLLQDINKDKPLMNQIFSQLA
ncbi:unnamed protein product [Paramecium pentaurelia]|uniref:Uncharacterized protein n=1 Tax=Paramecium pentaurelia TaxID=43138 RepID=A0A8S1YQQ6_9CILI|nr:unnamed protein product [Paramecium pentaurelia]